MEEGLPAASPRTAAAAAAAATGLVVLEAILFRRVMRWLVLTTPREMECEWRRPLDWRVWGVVEWKGLEEEEEEAAAAVVVVEDSCESWFRMSVGEDRQAARFGPGRTHLEGSHCRE